MAQDLKVKKQSVEITQEDLKKVNGGIMPVSGEVQDRMGIISDTRSSGKS